MKIKLKDTNKFKKILLIKGYSQRGFGRELGISEPYANQIANGTRNPGPKIANRIIELLSCEFDDIFFIDEDSKSKQSTA